MADKYWWQKDEEEDKKQQGNTQQSESTGYWWQRENLGTTIGNKASEQVNNWLKKHNSYISGYQKRYANRKYSYEDAYVKDSSSWLDTVSKQADELEAERKSILAYLDQYKGYINQEWAEDVRKTLASGSYSQQQIRKSATQDNEWWNSFGSDADLVGKYGSAEGVYSYFQRADGYNKKYAGMGVADLQTALNALEDGEEKEWLAYNQTNIAKNTLSQNTDWNERSRYKTTYRGGETYNAWSGMYTDTGFDDLTYDYINGNKLARDISLVNDIASNASFLGLDKSYLKQMTPDEIAVYNYLYDPNDTTAANAYLEILLSDLNYRQREAEQKYWAEYAKAHPFGSSAFSIMISPMKGLSAIGQIADYTADGTIDQNAGYNKFSYIPSTIRTQVSSDIVANSKNKKWGEVGSWTYQLGMGMGDFLMNTAVSGGNSAISLALMGSGAMADTVISAKDRGLSDDQAMILGVVAGGAEIVTEKFSLDALFKGGLEKGAMKYILTNAFTEGTEEVSSSLINLFADILVSKDKSEWQMSINDYLAKNPNASEQEAFMSVLGDTALSLGLDFLGGALMGGAMGAGGAGINYVANAAPYVQENRDALKKYDGKTDALIQEGLESDKKSTSYYLANKYQQQVQGKDGKKGKALTGYQIRQLLAANQEQIAPKDLKLIQKAAEKRLSELGQTEDVAKVAELATKRATGQNLTRAEKRFLATSEYGARVANELMPKNIQSGEYTTGWAEEIGTRQVNAKEYNKAKIDQVRSIIEEMQKMEDPAQYKSLSERAGTEGRFGVSESGKAVIRSTGEEIDLSTLDVKTVGDGELTFQVGDREVSAGDIDFADGKQSFLVSAVSNIENITAKDATVVIHELVDMDKPLGLQLNGIDEAFTYGYYNYSEEDLKAGEFAKNLTDKQMMSAYELGKAARRDSNDSKVETYKRMRTAADAIAEKNAAEGKSTDAKNLTITYNLGGGKVVSIDEAGITDEKQSGAVKVAEILHKLGLGTRVEFFSSYESDSLTVKDRKTGETKKARVFINDAGVEQIAYSGVHRKADGTIRVDLNAYNGRGLTLNALAHELTHFIQQWSDTKYKVLVDFLMETYEKTDMTMHERVLREQKRLEDIRGKKVSYDEAYDEVVANAMMKMFDDGKLVERLTELKAKDKNLAQKLWEGFKKILAKFLGIYEKEGALFLDTADLMEMKDAFEQLQNMFAEALVEASENYQAYLITKEAGLEFVAVEDVSQFSYSSLAEAAGFVAVQEKNDDGTITRSFTRDGKKVSKVTVEDIDNSPIGAFINFSVEMKDISEADALRQKEMFAKICTMACKTNDFAMTMQFVGSAVFTGMKANADKQYGTTYDFPSICTKTQAVIDAMSAKMKKLGRGLNTNEIVQLYADVFATGNPVPCPECYVFSRWIGIGGLLDNIKKYQDYYGDMAVEDVAAEYRKMKAEVSKFAEEQGISFGKAKGALTSKLTKEYNKLTEKVEKQQNQGEKVKPSDLKRLEELEPMMNTVKGMTWLENVYFADSSLKKVNPKFRVPNEVLFDLNNGEAFATQYKEAWAFRTTQGAGYGKAITPYAEARLGEGVLVTNNTTNAIKGRAQGTLNNYFLNQMGKLDKQSRDALKKARLKQKIQAFLGGQRFQSTSDARYENASDYLLAALEMQAMGGMVQCYTKVDGAVPAFSAWGFSINQSLMPLNGGLDENGNVQDTPVGGMKPSVAFDNRNKHESAGTITIGVNDNHIRAMFKQWVRDFIIPYHASGGKADTIAEFRRIQEGKEEKGEAVRSTDYSRTQSDKVLSDEVLRWQGKTEAQIQRIHEIRAARIAILTGGNPNMTVVRSNRFLSALYDKFNGGEWDGVKVAKSKVESQIFPNEFWDQTVTYDESAKIVKDYLEYCNDLGFLHRFSGMIPSNGKLVPAKGYNEKGERVQLTDLAYKYDENGKKTDEVEEFFWKVLTDRRMYDNNGNYLPQKVVTLNDTTADTVTNFAKHNQGRQYDKAKAEALAQKIAKGEQYASQETDAEGYDTRNLAWAIESGVINESDQARFWEAIAEIQKLRYNSFARTKNGAYIIETVNTMMFTDGDYKAPTLSKVIVFPYGEFVDTSEERTMIRNEARITGRTNKSTEIIEKLSGPGFVTEYYTPHYRSDGREIARGEGTHGSGTASQSEGRGVRHGGTDGLQSGQKVKRDFLADDKLKGNYTVSEIGEMFDAWNSDPELSDLSKKVFAKLQSIQDEYTNASWGKPYGIRFATNERMEKAFYHAPIGVFKAERNSDFYGITYNIDRFNKLDDQQKAKVLLHEAIHACTVKYIESVERRIPKHIDVLNFNAGEDWSKESKAALTLIQIFEQVRTVESRTEYGQKDAYEMTAELSNPEFRDLLKKQSLWGRVVDAIKRILGIDSKTNALDAASKALEKILELDVPKTAGEVYSSQETDRDYLDAVKRGDMETVQKMVNKAAKVADYDARMFHETDADNIHIFDISRGDHGGTDYETPYGIFTKSSRKSIGLGSKQMELFVKARNTLRVENREDVLNKIPGFAKYYDQIQAIDKKYDAISNRLENEELDALQEWMEEHPDVDMDEVFPLEYIAEGKPADIDYPKYLEAHEKYMKNRNEWEAEYAAVAVKAKQFITDYLRNNGYDSMYFVVDGGSRGRQTDSLIVLDKNQVKSADPVTYDDKGNVIPLSERFNTEKDDIRYSEHASNADLAEMDDTALYIKNTDKANYIDMIFNGAKTEETRSRRTLDAFVGKDFYVTDGKYVYGSIVLGEPHKYTEAEFHKKENQLKHRVPVGDKYDIKPGGTKWAYPIESYKKFDQPKKLSDSKEYKNSFQARQVRYSGHETDYSNRELLANAFEGLSQNSDEYKMIQEYKGRIKLLNEQEEKLAKLNAEIREIRFTEGKYDAKKLKELEAKAKNIANDINRQDKKLLDMEVSEPFRKVIEQERKKEAQKTKAHVKEIQKNKQARAEQTELRHKIRKAVRDLDKILNRGNKKQNVKEDMKGFVSKALEIADYLFTDHISNDELIRKGITVRMTPKEAALVKETEDILSQIYDNADSLTDEEFTRLDAKRKANEDKLRDLLTAQRNERLNTPVYDLFNSLVTEYASLKNSKQDAVRAAYNVDLERLLRQFMGDNMDGTDSDRKKLLQNMRVADMTTKELQKLLDAYKAVLTNVRDANKVFVKGKIESIDKAAEKLTRDFSKRKIPDKKLAIVARNIANKIGWDYEKLYYALDRIGSETFTELIMNIADSENIVMQDVIEAAEFRDEMVEKYGFNNWDVNKEIDREFLDNTGKKFKMTLGQLMALYAYSRREGAWDHIEYGGFVFGEAALTNPKPADSYKLSKEQCEALTNLLTKEQKGYVEDMQKFLSETMGEKGNEVSMLLYGIKMFGEKNYFPIKVAGQFKAQANESQAKAAAGFSTMSNAGFTHAQNPNAKAPFVLEGFNEVWADHVNEMSRYHGTVPALEDLRRVMNRSSYSESGMESMAIKQLMENSFGKEAVEYFDNLYREANSGAITDKLQHKSHKLLNLFRKNSVAYSLSVLIQQPASIVRAYAMIPKKYFGLKGFGTITSGVVKAASDRWTKAHTNAYNEMLKYAPGVTLAKEIGGFDTHTGGSIRSYLLDTNKSLKQKWKTGTALEKGKAVMDLVDDNEIANLPNLADKIAWIEIWNACKRETVATHKNLAPNTEEFMQAVGERFTEVIRATQVYDSMFAKSPMLKSKNLAVQYLVSFMNEPNTVANMAEKAVRDVIKGDWKGGATTAVAVIRSIIFTNALKSLIYAMRDDDEDETYIEKYIEAVAGNMMDDFNPLNYIPLVRDAWSLAQGYDVERADMAIVADALDALSRVIKNATTETDDMTEERLAEFDKKVTEANWKLVESLASFFGIPVKNIRREVNGVINHARIAAANAGKTTAHSALEKFRKAVIDSIPFMSTDSKQDTLYDAILKGDRQYVERLKAGYKDEDSFNSAIRKLLRENDPRIHEAALAYFNGNLDEYKRIFKEIRSDDKHNIIGFDNTMEAIMSEVSAIKGEQEPKTESSAYNATDFVNAILVGSTDLAQTMKEDIISYKVAQGDTREEAEKAFADSVATSTRNAFDSDLLDEAGAEKMLQEYAGMDEEESAEKTSYWAFIKAHPQYRGDLSQANVEKYHEFAEPAEIPLDVFVRYVNGTRGIETIRDEWGDEVKSKRDQVLEVIDSLPLTWQQKDALYLAAGYAESKIWDVPW